MNPVLKGSYRDRKILETIKEYKALDTNQVRTLIFPATQYGHRKAQKRLEVLHKKGRVKRSRVSIDRPYVYYFEKQGMIEHLIDLNWVRIWFRQRMKSWEKMWCWYYEQDYGILRADGFCGIKNTITGDIRFWFVELDRSNNKMDKGEKYNALYESDKLDNLWWVKYTKRFPGIFIATHRNLSIKNRNGLEFVIRSIDSIKGEKGNVANNKKLVTQANRY